LVFYNDGLPQRIELRGVSKILDLARGDECAELFVIALELIQWYVNNAFVESRNTGWFLDAFFEFDVFVPERVALIIETNELGAAFEKPERLAWSKGKVEYRAVSSDKTRINP
jgi:hypothetical protein